MVETTTSVTSGRPFARGESSLVDDDQVLSGVEGRCVGAVQSMNVCSMIEGGWGMGRSLVLDRAAEAAQSSGGIVLRVGARAEDRAVPFILLRRVLDAAATLFTLHERSDDALTAVWHLIERDGERGIEALGVAVEEMLRALGDVGPVLLCIDDADLADESTMRTLSALCQRVGRGQPWLLMTTSPRHRGTAPLVVDELLARHLVRHVELASLDRETIEGLVRQQLGVESTRGFLDAVFEATAGREEFVLDLLAACRDAGFAPETTTLADLASLRLANVSRDVRTRLERVGPGARDVLELLVMNAGSSELSTVLHMAEIGTAERGRVLVELRDAELLAPDTIDVIAPVIRWAIVQSMTPGHRSALHQRWANHLLSSGTDDVSLAHHLLASTLEWGASAMGLRDVAHRLLVGGEVSLALECVRTLLELCPTSEQPSLLLDAAGCELELGEHSGLSSFKEALARGVHGDDVVAVALRLMDRLRDWSELRAEGVALLQSVSPHLDGVDPTSRLQFELALTVLSGHPAQRTFDLARVERSLVTCDPEASCGRMAQLFVDVNYCERDASASAAEITERFGSSFVEHVMPVRDLVGEVVLMRVGRLLLHSDQFDTVDEFLEVARRRAYSADDVALEDHALRLIVLSSLWQGSLEHAEEALRRHDALGGVIARQPVVGASDLLIARYRLDEALHRFGWNELERIVDPLECAGALVERGRLLSTAGRADEALEVFMRARDVTSRAGLGLDVVVAWRAAMAEALAKLGHWEQASTLASEHLDAARAFGARRGLGAALRTMAVVERDTDVRVTWLSEALGVLEGSPARLEHANVLIDLGAVLLERGEHDGARSSLTQGLALATECKAERLVNVAQAQLASMESTPGHPGDVGVSFVYS